MRELDDILDNTQNEKELVSIVKMSPMLVYYLICIETKNVNILYGIYLNRKLIIIISVNKFISMKKKKRL